MQSEASKRTELIGLKGIAAIIVILNHYILAFYPNLVNKGLLGKAIVNTPLNIIYNGNFAVCIFFVISGYLLAYKFFMFNNEESIRSAAIRRYFRLMIPMLITIILCYFMMKLGLLYNIETAELTNSAWLANHYNFNPNFIEAMNQAVFGIFLGKSATYNSVLWTMYYELWGSFLILSIASILKKSKNRYFIYFVLSVVLRNTYFLAFVLGLFICDFSTSKIGQEKKINKYYKVIIFIIGLWFSSYNGSSMYDLMKLSFINDGNAFYHSIGAAMIVFSVVNFSLLKKIFSSKYMVMLGNISAPLYYFHWIILNSFSCWLFLRIITHFGFYQAFAISFIFSILLDIAIAKISIPIVDKLPNDISNYVYRKYFK